VNAGTGKIMALISMARSVPYLAMHCFEFFYYFPATLAGIMSPTILIDHH
jgi:hypothetical protein